MKGRNNARKTRIVKETIGLLCPDTCGQCASWESKNSYEACAYSFGANASDTACIRFAKKEESK
jgi:hypothetical protein